MDLQDNALLKRLAARRDFWLPMLLGLVLFWCFTGGSILPTDHLAWILNQDDPTQHYLGWTFFRHAPLLQFPLGKNTAFGEALGSSIVFSDSVPLMAFLLKPFTSWLPADFQYFGLWILLCFMLQAFFAWRILALFTGDHWLVAAGTCFFVLSPAMLFRLEGHEALVGHWILLAAIWLLLQPGSKALRWAVLASVACMVHAYLAAMVGAVWLTDLLRRVAFRRNGVLGAGGEALLVMACMLFTAWATGYFFPGTVEVGFGYYRFNLDAFFNPLYQFSLFRYGAVHSPGELEGFSYLGAGMLGLCMLAASGLAWPHERALRPTAYTVLPVTLLCTICLAYAMSNKVAWQGDELFNYPIPDIASFPTLVFRASGRFIWPLLYWLQIGILALLFAWLPSRSARIALALALLVQLVDLSSASTYFRDRWQSPYVNLMTSPFWQDAQKRYRRVAFAPLVRKPEGANEIGLWAARAGMSVNGGYLARVDLPQMDRVAKATEDELVQRHWRDDTLYVIDDAALWSRLQPLVALGTDLAIEVDGHHVLASAWCRGQRGCDVGATVAATMLGKPDITDFRPGGNARPRLLSGWSMDEDSGIWTEGKVARMRLPVPGEGPLVLRLEYDQFPTRARRGQRVAIQVNGHDLGTWSSAFAQHQVRQVRIPADIAAAGHGVLNVDIDVPDAIVPLSIGYNSDVREIALYMQRVEVRRAR